LDLKERKQLENGESYTTSNLIRTPHNIVVMGSRRLGYEGNVARMGEVRTAYRTSVS